MCRVVFSFKRSGIIGESSFICFHLIIMDQNFLLITTTIPATVDFEKFYHDPTRYLSSQFLGAINAQEGSFNVS
jgi:hypothetical protein